MCNGDYFNGKEHVIEPTNNNRKGSSLISAENICYHSVHGRVILTLYKLPLDQNQYKTQSHF